LKRKYPAIDVDQELAAAKAFNDYPKGLVHHELIIGGEVSGRSIVKSVLALAHRAGIPASICADALDYLRDVAAAPCFGYYYATDLVSDRPAEMPLHCVSVEAAPESGLILGYVEYFGVHRIVVCLGRNYSGDRIKSSYAIDPRSGEQLDFSIRLGFSESDIDAIYKYEMIPDGAMEQALANVIPAALKKKSEAERQRVIKEATEYAFAHCGAKPGEMLTQEQIAKLPGLMAEKLTPFMHHLFNRPKP
jgi:hypothetical protein